MSVSACYCRSGSGTEPVALRRIVGCESNARSPFAFPVGLALEQVHVPTGKHHGNAARDYQRCSHVRSGHMVATHQQLFRLAS